ncbi:MAG: twin-arginine translocation signal domain-containing protein, partial [Actinomycetota bacterium]|nr:twin-arginine translocation signal domain-containing protein [Actinomycetota bacterium]
MTDREPVDQASPASSTSPASGVQARHSRRNFLTLTGAAGLGVAATGWALSPQALASTALATRTPAPLAAKGGRTAVPTFTPIRPPATPLAVRSPYLSTWMATDSLAGTWPTFWTGRVTAMAGIAQI